MTPIVTALLAFVAAAGLMTVTPGLYTALVLRTAATEGALKAALAGLGVVVGCLGWAALVALGLGALLAASQAAYTALRWIGAAYLVWLGAKMILHPRRGFVLDAAPAAGEGRAAFLRGALTNLLNPKVGVFYVSFLPQFVPHGVPAGPFILLLGAIHGVLGLIWFAALIAATRPISRVLRRPKVIEGLDRTTGGIFLLFGAALAFESRRR